jgi:hypothetical protein
LDVINARKIREIGDYSNKLLLKNIFIFAMNLFVKLIFMENEALNITNLKKKKLRKKEEERGEVLFR